MGQMGEFSFSRAWSLVIKKSHTPLYALAGSRFSRNTGALCKNLRDRFDSQLPTRDLFREN